MVIVLTPHCYTTASVLSRYANYETLCFQLFTCILVSYVDDSIEPISSSNAEIQSETADLTPEVVQTPEEDSPWSISRMWAWGRNLTSAENTPNSREADSAVIYREGQQLQATKVAMRNSVESSLEEAVSTSEPADELPDRVLWRRDDSTISQGFDDSEDTFVVEDDGDYAIDQLTKEGSKWKPSSWIDPWLESNENSSVQTEAKEESIDGRPAAMEQMEIGLTSGAETTINSDDSATSESGRTKEEKPKPAWLMTNSEDSLHSNVDDSKTSQLAKIAVLGSRQQYEPLN